MNTPDIAALPNTSWVLKGCNKSINHDLIDERYVVALCKKLSSTLVEPAKFTSEIKAPISDIRSEPPIFLQKLYRLSLDSRIEDVEVDRAASIGLAGGAA